MTIQLHKLYKDVKDLPANHLKKVLREIYIPTEMVIYEPQLVSPSSARIYDTQLWYVNDKIMDYNELRTLPSFKGTSYYDDIYLVEVWMNYGDDGHTEYSLKGWRYVQASLFDQEITGHEWLRQGKLPICMTCAEYPEDRTRQMDMLAVYQNISKIV